MKERVYTLEELRAAITIFETPMAVARGDRVLAVNAAYSELLGRSSEEMEGHSWLEFLPREEATRLWERSQLRARGALPPGASYPVIVQHASGRTVHLLLQTTWVRAQDGGELTLAVFQHLAELQQHEEVTDLLAAAAAEMVAARSEAGAREAAIGHFAAQGVRAKFLRPGDPDFADGAAQAHASKRPMFGGAETPNPTMVFLPVDGPYGPEVLTLEGKQMATSHAASLSLFSRLVGSALVTGNMIADLEAMSRESQRQLTESRLLLDLARTTSGTLQLRAILDAASDFLVKLLDVSNCFVMFYDEQRRALRGAGASAAHRDFFRTVYLPIDNPGVATACARERRRVIVEDTEHTDVPFNPVMVERFHERALVAFPMVARDVFLGVVLVDDTRPRHFAPQLLEMAEASVAQVALSVSNARLYESLRQSYAELEATRAEMLGRERLAALGELSAVVAHEVRNPLGVIFNAVSSLRQHVPEEGDVGLLVGIIAEESDRLNRIVGDLLDFARPRTLSLELEDVGKLVADSIEAARADPSVDGRLRFESSIDENLPRVPMDRYLLRQAMVNVLSNAAQAMPQGGKVTVAAALDEKRDDAPGPGTVRIDISDEGPGIPADLAERIFEPFFTTKAQGTGLGLAVVKRIVEAHKGEVGVHSVPGRGTTFSFHLPLESRPASQT